MAEMLKGTLRTVGGNRNPVLELAEKEHEAYVIPKTVQLKYRGSELTPTHFDKHGNPQIGGMMRDVLLWKNRQLLREGKGTGSMATLEVEYSYTVSPTQVDIPITLRLPKGGVCPICGRPITLEQLDSLAPRSAHPEWYYSGNGPAWSVTFVEGESMQPAATHTDCYEMYHTMRWTDIVMTAVEDNILNGPIDKENQLHWGKGEKGVQFEEIPSQDLTKLSYVRRPWFRFRTPFGSFDVCGGRYTTQINLLPDFREFDLEKLQPDVVDVRRMNGNRVAVCGSHPARLGAALHFLRRAVWPDKTMEERLEEYLHSQKSTRKTFLGCLFK